MTENLILILLSVVALGGIMWTVWDIHLDRRRRR
ncbi:hypothetical protein JOF55_000114 [Haloactinomyces albus]|uniref:Uncharacterized protein n=1 Tax=Haloactinomyces albus TaxID=1352928 RepID=A0AAE3ZA46_9ACTN|nr:hypothetical protein [Haloactinomyces albus]